MNRGVKIVLASGVLLAGIAAAMLFRHPAPQTRPPRPGPSDGLVLRQPSEPQIAELPASDRLTAQIDPSADAPAPHKSGTSGRSAASPAPMEPGQPPPRLAKSYPPFHDKMAPGWDPATRPKGPQPERLSEPVRTHRIVDGDTLAALAERYLGDAERYLEIYEANRDRLPSPEVLPIGVELEIPLRREPASSSPSPIPHQPLVPVAPASPRRHAPQR